MYINSDINDTEIRITNNKPINFKNRVVYFI